MIRTRSFAVILLIALIGTVPSAYAEERDDFIPTGGVYKAKSGASAVTNPYQPLQYNTIADAIQNKSATGQKEQNSYQMIRGKAEAQKKLFRDAEVKVKNCAAGDYNNCQ